MNRDQQTSTSPSSRRTFSDRISAVGAKINRALSSDAGRGGYNPETESITSTVVEGQDRSSSRGRNFQSSGRGGAGNIHSTPAASNGEVQDFPWPRGRERAPVTRAAPTQVVRSTGRGGSGNFSQSPPAADPSYSLRDREILRAHAEADKTAFRSSGRGGIGNIVHPSYPTPPSSDPSSRSRSRSIDPVASPTTTDIRLGVGAGYSPSPSRERRDVNGYPVNGVDGYGRGNGT
ncbi:hypothetical protein DFH08DRAFT_1075491 [Mycena albidolilacea]|uniref:Uncharacterized protein n=1 Tax=Mycena albidolilacea TaxID=1033008 RepID=A0AAD7EYP5_9AGAR|nr:hypothetical protein DFH08DRAFT_1075491 [Mycena albidolilacea]